MANLKTLQNKLSRIMMVGKVTTPHGCLGARLPNGVVFLFFRENEKWVAQCTTSSQVITL